MRKLTFKTWTIFLALVGFLLIVFSLTFHFYALQLLINMHIFQNSMLIDGSEALKNWRKPAEMEVKVWLYNITNAERAIAGEEPVSTTEIGPYVYRTIYSRMELDENDPEQFPSTDFLTFNHKKESFFNKSASKTLSEDDLVYVFDILFMSLVINADRSEGQERSSVLDVMASLFPNDQPAILGPIPVKKILFDGIPINCNADPLKLTPLMCKGLKKISPDMFWSDPQGNSFYALLRPYNATSSDTMTISRGLKNENSVEKVVAINGDKNGLGSWDDKYCNMLNGSEIPYSKTNLKKTDLVYYYERDLCRSVYGIYLRKVDIGDIEAYRYAISKDIFAAPTENPENSCFCSEPPCTTGFFDLMPCKGSSNFLTLPHYHFTANPDSWNNNTKLQPELADRQDGFLTYADIEPNTGKPLVLVRRHQLNIKVQKIAEVAKISKIVGSMIPVFWLEDSFMVSDYILEDLSKSISKINCARIVSLLPIALGVSLIAIASGLIIYWKQLLCCQNKGQIMAERIDNDNQEIISSINLIRHSQDNSQFNDSQIFSNDISKPNHSSVNNHPQVEHKIIDSSRKKAFVNQLYEMNFM